MKWGLGTPRPQPRDLVCYVSKEIGTATGTSLPRSEGRSENGLRLGGGVRRSGESGSLGAASLDGGGGMGSNA